MAADENFLSRWSRRKTQAKVTSPEAPATAAAPVAAGVLPSAAPAPVEQAPLPAVESLTPESDFSPFMAPEVDGDVRRKALKTLFSDPRFNTMDMMDVYVDDYSKPDPIPASWMDKLEQLSRLGDRAGRDREEAERKAQAEAEAAAAAQTAQTAQTADQALSPPPQATPTPAPAQAPAEAGAGRGMPPAPVGDSGT